MITSTLIGTGTAPRPLDEAIRLLPGPGIMQTLETLLYHVRLPHVLPLPRILGAVVASAAALQP